LTTQWTTAAAPSAPSDHFTNGGMMNESMIFPSESRRS
jgi:hypothetical protein